MKIYIAGPMSGIPQFNYPAFISAAGALRAEGYDVYCPAEMDNSTTVAAAWASPDGSLREEDWDSADGTWGDFLSRDVKLIADDCEAVALLHGWSESRGARLEAFVALQLGYPLYEYFDFGLHELDSHYALELIAINTVNQGDVSRYGRQYESIL
jgi:hypothetical protein